MGGVAVVVEAVVAGVVDVDSVVSFGGSVVASVLAVEVVAIVVASVVVAAVVVVAAEVVVVVVLVVVVVVVVGAGVGAVGVQPPLLEPVSTIVPAGTPSI